MILAFSIDFPIDTTIPSIGEEEGDCAASFLTYLPTYLLYLRYRILNTSRVRSTKRYLSAMLLQPSPHSCLETCDVAQAPTVAVYT